MQWHLFVLCSLLTYQTIIILFLPFSCKKKKKCIGQLRKIIVHILKEKSPNSIHSVFVHIVFGEYRSTNSKCACLNLYCPCAHYCTTLGLCSKKTVLSAVLYAVTLISRGV